MEPILSLTDSPFSGGSSQIGFHLYSCARPAYVSLTTPQSQRCKFRGAICQSNDTHLPTARASLHSLVFINFHHFAAHASPPPSCRRRRRRRSISVTAVAAARGRQLLLTRSAHAAATDRVTNRLFWQRGLMHALAFRLSAFWLAGTTPPT